MTSHGELVLVPLPTHSPPAFEAIDRAEHSVRGAELMSRRKKYTRNLGRARAERVPTRGTGARYIRFAHADEPFGVF
jgi:hypothetical protein